MRGALRLCCATEIAASAGAPLAAPWGRYGARRVTPMLPAFSRRGLSRAKNRAP